MTVTPRGIVRVIEMKPFSPAYSAARRELATIVAVL